MNDAEPQPAPAAPDDAACPPHLTGEAKTLWERVAPNAIEIGLITVADLAHLEAYCAAYGRWREAEAESDKLGLELAIAKGFRNVAVKERQLMLQYGGKLGFDPASRSSVRIPPKQPVSKSAAFRLTKGESA